MMALSLPLGYLTPRVKVSVKVRIPVLRSSCFRGPE
jgi:hypothetical protein